LAASAFVATNTAAAMATLSWALIEYLHRGKASALGAASGAVAGLVAITPAAGFVDLSGALWIGLLVSPICYFFVVVIKQKFGYDDSLDAFGVHGVGGTFGALATGLWANPAVNTAKGLFYGNPGQFVIQLKTVIATMAYSAVVTLVLAFLVEKLVGEKLVDVRHSIAVQRQAVVELKRRLQKLSDVGEKQKEYQAKKQDAEFRLKVFKQHGVEEKLQKQRDYAMDARRIEEMVSATKAFDESLQSLLGEHQDRLWNLSQHVSVHNEAFFGEVLRIFDRMLDHVKALNTMSSSIRGETLPTLRRKDADFVLMRTGMQSEFAQAQRLIDESLRAEGREQIRPEEFLQLSTRLDQERLLLNELRKEADRAQQLDSVLMSQLDAFDGLLAEEFRLVREEVDEINAQNASLSVESAFRGDREGFKTFLRILDDGRIAIAALALGMASACLDASVAYRLGKYMEVFVNGTNLTNEVQRYYLVWQDQPAHSSFSERMYTIGVRGQW